MAEDCASSLGVLKTQKTAHQKSEIKEIMTIAFIEISNLNEMNILCCFAAFDDEWELPFFRFTDVGSINEMDLCNDKKLQRHLSRANLPATKNSLKEEFGLQIKSQSIC